MEIKMENKIREILNDIDEDILQYNGENMLDEGIIDSFTIMEIIVEIEEKIGITINPDDITEENFKTIKAIVKLVEKIAQK